MGKKIANMTINRAVMQTAVNSDMMMVTEYIARHRPVWCLVSGELSTSSSTQWCNDAMIRSMEGSELGW